MIGEQVMVVSRQRNGVDADGNDAWSETSQQVNGCLVWPTRSDETTQGADTVSTGVAVWFPAGTTVAATDRIILRGVGYEIVGQPFAYFSPVNGSATGVLANAQVVTG